MTVREALGAAARRLQAVSQTPRLDAELLMAEALGVSRDDVLLQLGDAIAPEAFPALVERRLAHEPIAYILRRRAFWTVELEVGPGVLVPRPDSETLIEAALDHFGPAGPRSILDLGTGPGTLLLAALDQWPGASGLGIDISDEALAFARGNARRMGLEARAEFRRGDWATGVEQRFDLILCNPPYVASGDALPPDVEHWEPAGALFAGADGLDAYRAIAVQLRDRLEPEGIACLEIGAGQAASVSALLSAQGFRLSSRSDLGQLVRCLIVGR